MTKEEKDEIQRVSMERHLQTVIVVIIVGLLGWVGSTVQATQVAVAQLAIEMEYMKLELQKPQARFANIEERLDIVERRLAADDKRR